jgi:hypothetical protein
MLSPEDLDRVIGHLEYPVVRYWVTAVADAATQLERYGGELAEARILGYLADLDAATQQLRAGASSASLIQADVLRWSDKGGGRLSGIQREYRRLQLLLAKALGLSLGASISQPEGNTLSRG